MGAKEVPPTLVVTGVALLLSLVVMAPVGTDIANAAQPALEKSAGKPLTSPEGLDAAAEAGRLAAEPVRTFLSRHAHARDKALFLDVSRRLRAPERRAEVAA